MKSPLNRTGKFSSLLLHWHLEKNDRKMPWKGEKDPYKIWLSEVILQQTRVEQGMEYYYKFISEFPTIQELAAAPDAKIYKLWEGLGYYNRCKNLIETARFISSELNAVFPNEYDQLKSLKGVGDYTAAAIASFAFNKPYAVVDGNVNRVLSRVFGITKALNTAAGRKYFSHLASELLDKNNPSIYNQALMDFGAVVCRPVHPHCESCVFKKYCFALKNNAIGQLPVKEKKAGIKRRWFYYLQIFHGNRVCIRKRTAKDIWANLYEFVLIETVKETPVNNILKEAVKRGILREKKFTLRAVSSLHHQQLSHQKISGRFIELSVLQKPRIPGLKCVFPSQLGRYPFPRFIHAWLKNKTLPVMKKIHHSG
jgi:A/G-specific adenine glycosylase